MSAREDGIRAALAKLGETADDMAASLRAAGITGIRENGEQCPLAVHLRREGFDDINVTRDDIELLGRVDPNLRVRLTEKRMPTPEPAREFIVRFDDAKDFADLADEDDGS